MPKLTIRHAAVKVRVAGRDLQDAANRYTGAVTYSAVGAIDGARIRHALGTEEARVAIRRVEKIKSAVAVGPGSPLWGELEETLPGATFKFFASVVGYVPGNRPKALLARPTWAVLSDSFELRMKRLIANKARGASAGEGSMATTTRDRYRQTIKQFGTFLTEHEVTHLDRIDRATIALFKVYREKGIAAKKQSRGGASIALDIAILHRVLKFAIDEGLMTTNPINLKHESKPGKNPKNGARPFTADELTRLRGAAGRDLFTFQVLRWTGLRGSDAIALRWKNVHFDRGTNGEIEIMTQKRSKLAIVPLSPELHDALDQAKGKRGPEDTVLINPVTASGYTSRARLYARILALGKRADVQRVTPHCLRDTFICDSLARGISNYIVAQMVADTTDTIEKHYAQFVPAARDTAASQFANGLGIEERASLEAQRGHKVVGFPAHVSPLSHRKS